MALRILRPDPEQDLYLIWGTTTDTVIAMGPRAEIEELAIEQQVAYSRAQISKEVSQNVERASIRGTSERGGELEQFHGSLGTLPPERLLAYAELCLVGQENSPEAYALFVPHEDD